MSGMILGPSTPKLSTWYFRLRICDIGGKQLYVLIVHARIRRVSVYCRFRVAEKAARFFFAHVFGLTP